MSHTVVAELVAAVLKVEVEVGQRVTAADSVVILESMKMEIPVLAEVAGSVVEVVVVAGDVVNDGDPLVVIEPRRPDRRVHEVLDAEPGRAMSDRACLRCKGVGIDCEGGSQYLNLYGGASMPITESDLAGLSDGNVVSTSGDKIGSIGQIYLDDQTGEPTFVTANTGLFGL